MCRSYLCRRMGSRCRGSDNAQMTRAAMIYLYVRLFVVVIAWVVGIAVLLELLALAARRHGISVPDGFVIGAVIGVAGGLGGWASRKIKHAQGGD